MKNKRNAQTQQNILQQQRSLPTRPVPVGVLDHHPLTKRDEGNCIYIATLNTLTLRTNERLQELEIALKNIKWDILGLSEED